MNDLISKEEALNLFFDEDSVEYKGSEVCGILRMLKPICSIKKNKKGNWVEIKGSDEDLFMCSNCGYFSAIGKTNFCPDCGTKMKK